MRYLYVACLALLAHAAGGPAPADSLALAPDSVATGSSAPALDSVSAPVAPDERWVRSQTDSTGECTEMLHWSGRGGLVRVFHPSGHLKEYLPYADLVAGKLHGVATTWYDDGQLAVQQTFLRGQRDGTLLAYYPNGQLKRHESLGQCFTPTGEPLAFFPYERPPLYPGGQAQLIKEISRQVRMWQPAGSLLLSQAQIHVSFQVGENGLVENPQVTVTDERFALVRANSNISHSLQTALNEGVAPLIRRVQQGLTTLAKPFYPGQRDGAAVRWQYRLTIPFSYGSTPR
jgi:protein TonB